MRRAASMPSSLGERTSMRQHVPVWKGGLLSRDRGSEHLVIVDLTGKAHIPVTP
jgi:hypothetical protein